MAIFRIHQNTPALPLQINFKFSLILICKICVLTSFLAFFLRIISKAAFPVNVASYKRNAWFFSRSQKFLSKVNNQDNTATKQLSCDLKALAEKIKEAAPAMPMWYVGHPHVLQELVSVPALLASDLGCGSKLPRERPKHRVAKSILVEAAALGQSKNWPKHEHSSIPHESNILPSQCRRGRKTI